MLMMPGSGLSAVVVGLGAAVVVVVVGLDVVAALVVAAVVVAGLVVVTALVVTADVVVDALEHPPNKLTTKRDTNETNTTVFLISTSNWKKLFRSHLAPCLPHHIHPHQSVDYWQHRASVPCSNASTSYGRIVTPVTQGVK